MRPGAGSPITSKTEFEIKRLNLVMRFAVVMIQNQLNFKKDSLGDYYQRFELV